MIVLRLRMLWLRLPVIGGLARLSKQQGLAGKWDGSWRDGEIQLCHMFQGYLNAIHRESFNNYLSYLGKAGDGGRTPAPVWLKWSLAAIVALESMAFALALFPNLSLSRIDARLATIMALGVAGLAGLLLLYFIYQAGGQAYRNHVIRECRRHLAAGEGPVVLGKLAEIQAHQPQASDDGDPPHIQCLRRVGSETGMQSILIAALLLLAVAGYSTLVHFKHQVAQQAVETTSIEMPRGSPAATLPDTAISPAAASDAGMGSDIVLGVLLLVTQMLGASIGYRHQLAAKQGRIAYESTRGYATYEEYFAHGDGLVQHSAEQSLKDLQRAGDAQQGKASDQRHHSFREFLFLTRQDEIKYDLQTIPHRAAKRDITGSRVESLLARIAELKHANRRAEAIALIQDLPEPEKSQVKARLLSQSAPHPEELSRRAAERQELEKIL